MFFVSDTEDAKRKKINDYLQREPMIAVLLAAANVEWTIGRCILFFSLNTNVEIHNALAKTHGLDRYKDLWKREVKSKSIPSLATIIKDWKNFKIAFELRHKLIHGRDTCTRNMAQKPVGILLQGVSDLYRFAESHGKHLNDRAPVRRKKKHATQ